MSVSFELDHDAGRNEHERLSTYKELRAMMGSPAYESKNDHGNDEVLARLAALPRDLRMHIEDNIRLDEQDGISDLEVLAERRVRYIEEAEKIYKEKRFGREFFSRLGINKKIQDALHDALSHEGEDGLSELARHAHVSIDINGLKAINDLGSHEVGNEFLKRMATLLDELREKALEGGEIESIDIAFEGGDEFTMAVAWRKDAAGDARERAETLRAYLNSGLRTAQHDLLPIDTIREEGIKIAEGFEGFTSSAGVGVTTLDEIATPETLSKIGRQVDDAAARVEGGLGEQARMQKTLFAAMGAVREDADHKMQIDKRETKEGLNPTMQEVLARNEEVREARREIARLSVELGRQASHIDILTRQHDICEASLRAVRPAA